MPSNKPHAWASKDEIRIWVWDEMEALDLARFPRPCHGRIPNFEGSKRIPDRLAEIEAYGRAEAVFVGPDLALKACRDRVVQDGKILAFATPGMREFKEYRPGMENRDTSIRGLKRFGEPLTSPVSIILLGSVAVDRAGYRIGKGAGYGDREVVWLRERGLVREGTLVLTVVHPLQLFDDFGYLMEPTDEPVDVILLADRVVPATRPQAGSSR